jgi:hypothetical protein
MNTYIILRRKGWAWAADLEKAAGRSSRVGTQEMADQVLWLRSYVLDEEGGELGTVCVYQAVSAQAAIEHASRAGLPCDEVIQVHQTIVINEDPIPQAA